MGRAPKKVVTTEELVEQPQAEEEAELESFLDAIGAEGSIKVKLYRLTTTGRQVFIQDGPPSIFSESQVQAEHGAGDYLVRSIVRGKSGRSKAFSVAAVPGQQSTPQSADSHYPELERQMIQLETQRVALERAQLELEAERKLREQRNHEILLKTLESRNGGGNASTVTELVAGLQGLQSLSGGGSPAAMMKELFGLFTTMFTQARELSGSGSTETDSMTSVLNAVLPRLLGSGDRGAAAIAPPVPVAPGAAPQLAPIAATVAPNGHGNGSEESERRRFLVQLKAKAKAGKDPAVWADYIEDNSDEPGPAWVLGVVRAYAWEQVFPGLCHVDNDLAAEPYRQWFEALYQALKFPPDEEVQADAAAGA